MLHPTSFVPQEKPEGTGYEGNHCWHCWQRGKPLKISLQPEVVLFPAKTCLF